MFYDDFKKQLFNIQNKFRDTVDELRTSEYDTFASLGLKRQQDN